MAELIFFTLLVSLAGAATSTHYHIVTSTALCTHYPVGTCFTLEELSSQVSVYDTGNITISFLPGEHLLTWNMTFAFANDITLNRELHNSSNSTQSRISSIRNAGFVFWNLHTLTVEALDIYGYEGNRFGVIAIFNTKHVLINKCRFIDNQVTKGYSGYYAGGGAIYLKSVISALIQNSTFINNSAGCLKCIGGGAVLIESSIVSIDSCSFERNTAPYGGALSQEHSNLTITNTSFNGNSADPQGGAIYIGWASSTVSIGSCSFEYNTASAGGALILIGSNTIITNTDFSSNSAPYGGCIHFRGGLLNISKCVLTNNSAFKGGAIFTIPFYLVKQGLSLNSLGNVYSGNTAHYGGAVHSFRGAASFSEDNFSNNSALEEGAAISHNSYPPISIRHCIFVDNWVTRSKNTGVVVISGSRSVNISEKVLFLNNCGSLHIVHSNAHFYGNTTFSNNTGGDAGGSITCTDGSVIVFGTTSRTTITGNTANYGGGLSFDQCTVYVYGSIAISDNTAKISGGGIYAFQSVIEFRPDHRAYLSPNQYSSVVQHTSITNNIANSNGGGIHLTATNIKVSNSHIHIYGNTAKQYGGGVYLEQSSQIDLTKWFHEDYNYTLDKGIYIRLEFHNNSAALRGGAVYVLDSTNAGVLCANTSQVNLRSKQCFLQTLRLYYNTWFVYRNTNVINTFFKYNTAGQTGSDIYGGLLDRCTVSPSAEILLYQNPYNGLQYLNATANFDCANGHIQHPSDFYNHISSDPVRVCFCENDLIDCNLTHSTVYTKKGRTFTLSIVAMDQVGKPVNATLISSLTSGDREIGRLKEGQELRKVKSWCTTLEYNVYSSDSMAELQLYADGPCSNQGISKQQVKISFLPCSCPIGLERFLPLIDCFCDCDRRLKSYVSNCSPLNSTIQINKNVWIDYINTSNASGFVTPHCPFDYCVEKPVNISLASPGEKDQQCAFNRTGRMCGQCEEGLSLVFASSRCQDCSNYYLFLLLPFALAGVALVAFILALNMTVATGTIHGLIFYANMLAANHSIFLPFSTSNFLTVFISWLNLDLGIETCFYDGMDSYGKFLLQLTFPAYVFLIIVAIIVLCDRSQRLAVLIGKRNPEATLYTLVLISYSKLIRIIITALQFTIVNYPDGTQKTVWLYDANVLYFSISHIPRFLAASIIILLGTVYTTLLLFGQLFGRCSEHKFMKWTTHKYYTHFIRAHQAPLSDKHRYWVGLLLLARLTHFLISAFAADAIIILSAGTVAFVLVIHKLMYKQIYNSWSLDLLETSFLVNLDVLALSTFYIRDASGSQRILAFISMTVCFITFLGIVLYHILDKCGIKISTLPQRALQCYRQRRCYQPVSNEEEELEELFDEDEHLLDIHEEQNYEDDNFTGPAHRHTPPIIRFAVRDDQLREPALDDLIPIQPEDYDIPPQPRPRRREMVTYAEVDIRADQEENNC